MTKSTPKLTPTKLRIILIITMTLLLAAAIAGFYFGQKTLSAYATEVSTKVAEAENSKDSVNQLQKLESELERLSSVRERTKSIVAESRSYLYQDQIIADLNNYANQAGISISQFNFQTEAAATGAAPATSAAPATPDANSSSPPPVTTSPTPAVKSTTVSITLKTPIKYENLIKFIRSIEQNLTKMQISGISLNPGEDAETISTDSLNIEVYIK
jgi:hypothetical protein